MVRKFACAALIFIATFLFFSCKKGNLDGKTLSLLMAESNPPESTSGQVDKAFAAKVAELSGGKITINLQCSGILGDEAKVMEMIAKPDSSIHLARVSASLASYGGEKSKLITIPYTFTNHEHFWKFASSDIAEEILSEPYEKGLGVKGIFYAEEGFRHFFSVSTLKSISDLKGKRVRTSNSKTLQDLTASLSAVPVEVPFSRLYSSLLNGETEVAEQPITNYYSNGFHIVAPNLILDRHMLGAVQVLINSSCWDSLSQGQREILTEAGKFASEYCRKTVENAEKETIAKLKAEGVTITDVKDLAPWRNACEKMRWESYKEFPELYERIIALGE